MTSNISQAAASFAQAAAKAAKGVTDSNAGRPDTSFAELIAGAADGERRAKDPRAHHEQREDRIAADFENLCGGHGVTRARRQIGMRMMSW